MFQVKGIIALKLGKQVITSKARYLLPGTKCSDATDFSARTVGAARSSPAAPAAELPTRRPTFRPQHRGRALTAQRGARFLGRPDHGDGTGPPQGGQGRGKAALG